MKRRALLGHLQEHGCVPHREGGSHSIWINPQTGRKETIPRHSEIKKFLARSICRSLSVPIPQVIDPQMGNNTPERKDYIMDSLVVPVEE